jgi:putative restriction endonuclease
MQSEKVNGAGYWTLVAMNGCQVNAHIKSINKLISVVNYGRFCDESFLYLSDSASRIYVKALLIETYFPAKTGGFVERIRFFNIFTIAFFNHLCLIYSEAFIQLMAN